MRGRFRILSRNCIGVLVLLSVLFSSSANSEERTVAIATVHPLATEAALGVYRDGGNALDAAVAAALTLGVVDCHNSGVGGSCFILLRRPDGSLLAIDGRDTAPAAATPDMFVRDGEGDTSLSQTGPLAVATPGSLAAYAEAVRLCGALPLSRLLAPGRRIAAEGFAIDANMARQLAALQPVLSEAPGARAVFLRPDGSAPEAGELLVQPDLAATYERVARLGPSYFYNGPFAQAVGDWMAANHGVLTARDFANYRAERREPIVSKYRGYTVIGFPPPSSGGVHVAQALNILEGFDVTDLFEKDPAEGVHLVAESMKLAFADRAYWLGDADYVDVPRGLLSKSYAKSLAEGISLDRAAKVARHGDPPSWRQDLFGRHTTHVAAADSDGYWVAITATINTSFGSKVVVPGTGVVLNNQMDDFAIYPGTPNAFGLIGADNNAIAGGKRPLSSMSPTLVLDQDGRPLLTVGAAGGPKIITQVLLAIVNTVDRGLSPAKALAQPRYHHQWAPDALSVEATMPEVIVEQLQAKGHTVDRLNAAGVSQMIARDSRRGFIALHDPRVEGQAAVASLGSEEPASGVASPGGSQP